MCAVRAPVQMRVRHAGKAAATVEPPAATLAIVHPTCAQSVMTGSQPHIGSRRRRPQRILLSHSQPRPGRRQGMDFSYTAEEEAFRSRLRAWLEKTSGEVFGR